MNPEDNLQPAFSYHQSSLYQCYNFKVEQNDKTSHRFQQHENLPHPHNQFEQNSQFRPSSFFFTPTSPRHFHFDVGHNHEAKPGYKTPKTEVSISKKINFKEQDQESNSQNQGFSQEIKGIKVSKGIYSRSIKNAKGLRRLSESVYRIVSQLGRTKYKEVAERLVEEISKNGGFSQKTRDQHNVKRRVYDALNVLISAGMLQKQGKDVVCSQPYQRRGAKLGTSENSRQINEKQKLLQEIKRKQDTINQKLQQFLKLNQSKYKIAQIVEKNKSGTFLEQNIVRFPLIGAIVKEQEMKIVKSKGNEVIFRFPQFSVLCGDTDLLLNLKQMVPSQDIEPENLYNVIERQDDDQSDLSFQIGFQKKVSISQHFNKRLQK